MSAAAGGERPKLDHGLRDAASRGDHKYLKKWASPNLLGVTLAGNNCLHIAAAKGHLQFCLDAAELKYTLLADINSLKETPMISAAKNGHSSVASLLLSIHTKEHSGDDLKKQLTDAILSQDIDDSNVLHHALHMCGKELVKKLITVAPDLCTRSNNSGESPMFLAARRNHTEIALDILALPGSLLCGPGGQTALHEAAIKGNEELARKIILKHSDLVKKSGKFMSNPVCQAVYYGQTEVLRVFLNHDRDVGYVMTDKGYSLLQVAADGGHVDTARVLLENCSDAPYGGINKTTCLHIAVTKGSEEFVRFILETEQLRGLVNSRDHNGNTPLLILYGMETPNRESIKALLTDKGTDPTMLNKRGTSPLWVLAKNINNAKTLIWNEAKMHILSADPGESSSVQILDRHAKQIHASRKNTKALAKNSSGIMGLAITIAAFSFAAILAAPGGYSAVVGSQGLPIMYSKPAYQAFLVTTSLSFVFSIVLAIICSLARTEDHEYLIHYRSVSLLLLLLAIASASASFATCLFTVLSPHLDLLVIGICILVSLVPALALLLLTWPVLKLGCQMGKSFDYNLLKMA